MFEARTGFLFFSFLFFSFQNLRLLKNSTDMKKWILRLN
jgi:hypothetical protein